MLKELFNTKTDDTVMIPLSELEEYKAKQMSQETELEVAYMKNDVLVSEAAKMMAEAEDKANAKIEQLRDAYFSSMYEYLELMRIAKDCIEKKSYKALKEYVAAYDKGELFMISTSDDIEEALEPVEDVIVAEAELDEAVTDFDDLDDFEVLFDDEA